jgi:hypothetical protein
LGHNESYYYLMYARGDSVNRAVTKKECDAFQKEQTFPAEPPITQPQASRTSGPRKLPTNTRLS